MESVKKWTVATSTKGGPWELEFSKQLFLTYEWAARRAFELNGHEGVYLHKPVEVTVTAVEEDEASNPIYLGALDPASLAALTSGEFDVRMANVTMEPWDGWFVGSMTAFQYNDDATYKVASFDIDDVLDPTQVGLLKDSYIRGEDIMDAVEGYEDE